MSYRLTEEGKKYNKSGLPESRLISMLKEGPVSMKDASVKLGHDFSIALQWCKKYGCIQVAGGRIVLTNPHVRDVEDQEKAIKALGSGKDVNENLLNALVQRKLVEKSGEDIVQRAEKAAGDEIIGLNTDIIKSGVWKDIKIKPYNVEAAGRMINVGKRQPYRRFLGEVRRKLVEMGFREMTGPTIELEFWNFDALYQPQNHPSRDWTQTYSLKHPKEGSLPEKSLVERVKAAHENGWRTGSTGWRYTWDPAKAAKLMPRAHGTAISARTLTKCEIPGKYFAI